MDFSNASNLWAAIFWGAVGSGYFIYGWRQKSAIPLAGGVAISLVCFFPALWMTLASLAIMAGVWWLLKQGY